MIFFIIAFLSSIVGAICGIGGGVIIKPVLDLLHVGSVASISFLSSCTVLSMSLYSVGTSLAGKKRLIDLRTVTPLAIGAVFGGIIGKYGFQFLSQTVSDSRMIGAIQSACLAIITFATFLYMINKNKIRTLQITTPALSAMIGAFLGILSSFLGIGGGPINLIVLFFFFSMDTKVAAACSLYIILFSQIASLLLSLFTGNIPSFETKSLLLMILGGIGGGIVGRAVNKHIYADTVDKLFQVLILLIVGISLYNFTGYLAA